MSTIITRCDTCKSPMGEMSISDYRYASNFQCWSCQHADEMWNDFISHSFNTMSVVSDTITTKKGGN